MIDTNLFNQLRGEIENYDAQREELIKKARDVLKSAKLLISTIEEVAGTTPVIVTGDFNSIPGSEPHQILIDGIPEIASTKLIDAKTISKFPHHGPNGTITRFQSASLPDNATIDYIFVKNNISVILHGTLSDSFDGRFPTDHMPVLAEIIIE